jgi:hypothetical protein
MGTALAFEQLTAQTTKAKSRSFDSAEKRSAQDDKVFGGARPLGIKTNNSAY